jgi:hypothetical protein
MKPLVYCIVATMQLTGQKPEEVIGDLEREITICTPATMRGLVVKLKADPGRWKSERAVQAVKFMINMQSPRGYTFLP